MAGDQGGSGRLALSVLDLVPVRSDQSSADAVAATIDLARVADRLGFRRYWLAEHHNMPSVAATSPPVMAGIVAASTVRMRVGSGGVMLPNHSPFVVAEQFATLEAAFPGRIDLGIGRAPGSDGVITALLRSGGHTSEVERFAANVDDIRALLAAEGAALRLSDGREYVVRATPHAASEPVVWLLGSSDFSARLAAERGLPYVFASHFAGGGTDAALALYRRGFTPSSTLEAPRTFLTVQAVVAETAAEAEALALPQLQHMAGLRSGLPLTRLRSVEEADEFDMSVFAPGVLDALRENWVIGDAQRAAERIEALAAQFAVDEVMVVPAASAPEGTDARRSPARERTLELLAEAFALPA